MENVERLKRQLLRDLVQENVDLMHRYIAARGNPDAMKEVIAEWTCAHAS